MDNEISSFTEILAKSEPKETLDEHTETVIQFLVKVLEWKKKGIKRIFEITSHSQDKILARLFAMSYLHDIGKTSYSFQKFIRKEQHSSFPHALLGVPFIVSAVEPLRVDSTEIFPEAISIMSHHTPFYYGLYATIQDNQADKFLIMDKALEFYNKLTESYENVFGKKYPFSLKDPKLDSSLYEILDIIKKPIKFNRPENLREIHSFFVDFLHTVDWLGSGKSFDYIFSENNILTKLESAMKQNKQFSGWNQIQQNTQGIDGNLLLSAPTGQGKTEGSLLWASRNVHLGKIIYLLPTRVTTNAIYKRLKFLGNSVGISHGTSALIVAEEERWINREIMARRLRGGSFMEPITVATVDQLLLPHFNWKYWEMIEQNASNSAIILDEIHAYDHYTLALITQMVKKFPKSRFCYMSATLPTYIQKHLTQLHQNKITIVQDKEHLDLSRHNIQFIETAIDNSVDEIRQYYKEGKKVLIILNTIKDAIRFYQNFSDLNIVLYHSRFIERDRRKKEKLIEEANDKNKGCIVVATQVVEVSLDIDFDILFTQITPLDALVQRLGRVNRKGKKGNSAVNVKIYDFGQYDYKVYGKNNLQRAKDIISNSLNNHILKEKQIQNLIELQYPTDETYDNFVKEWDRVAEQLELFKECLWEVQTLRLRDDMKALMKLAQTRDNKLPEISVIPEAFKNEIEQIDENKRLEISNYFVKVPLLEFKKGINTTTDDSHLVFCNMNYSFELGARPIN